MNIELFSISSLLRFWRSRQQLMVAMCSKDSSVSCRSTLLGIYVLVVLHTKVRLAIPSTSRGCVDSSYIPHTKHDGLIDLISVFSRLLSTVCTPDNIQTGFITNGMLDCHVRRYPYFNGMFATCKSNPTIEQYANIC